MPTAPAPFRAFVLAAARACACACACACVLVLAAPSAVGAQAQTPSRLPLQQMHHTTWGELEGLAPAVRERVVRSPDGYLWLGGPDALVRFDGVRFTRFDASTTPELASAAPGGLYPRLVDRDGTMWIARSDGALVHYRDGRFRVAVRGRGAGWHVPHVAQDRSGVMWAMVAAPHGLHVVSGDSLVTAELPSSILHADMAGLVADSGSGVWFGMRNLRLVHLTSRGAEVFSVPSTIGAARATPLLQSSDGAIWVFGDGLQVLRAGQWSTLRMPDGSQILPMRAAEDASGAVWVGTRAHGVLRFAGGAAEQFSERDGLSDAMAATVLPDAEGNNWILTEAGLDRLRTAPFAPVGAAHGLPIESPHWLAVDASGALWMREYSGSSLYLVDGGAVRGHPGSVTSRELRDPLPSRYSPQLPARSGGLWVTMRNGWIGRATPDRRVPAGFGAPATAVEQFALLEDRQGGLWVAGQQRGLTRRVAGSVRQIPLPASVESQPVRLVAEDTDGRIIVSAPGDTSLLFFVGDRIVRRVGRAEGLHRPFSGGVIDGRDTLWGHDGDGRLVRVIGSSVRHIEDPALTALLPSNVSPLRPTSVALVPSGERFFLASTSGIASVSRAALHAAADGRAPLPPLRRYASLDGVRSGRLTSTNRSAAVRAADGRVWFSTPDGLVVFDERYAAPNVVAPRVHIEELLVADRPLAFDSLARVPAGSALLEIRFTATALRVPERVRIEFRLDGVDPQWRTADATRRVMYPQLRPRTYTFHVRAWNEDGVPAAQEAVLRLRVMPFWYQSWWFLTLAVLAAVGTIVAAVGYSLRSRARRAAERLSARFEATLTERTRLAGELHDTLLQGFTGITLQLQALRGRMVDAPNEVERELGRVLTVADHALREARSTVWDMRAPELEGQDVASAIEEVSRQALASHLLTGGAPVDVSVSVTGERGRVSPTAETAALRIGREAVTNALRHALPARIDISIAFEPTSLRITVVDDGVGFDLAETRPAEGVGHWGLIGMQERARRAGGTLHVTSAAGAGTTIDLRLPVG